MQRRQTNKREGLATVEFAVLLPFILLLLLGIWEVGRLTEAQQLMSNAAREGGRRGSLGIFTKAQIETAVKTYLEKAGIPTAKATITFKNVTADKTDPTSATQFSEFRMTVSVPVKELRWTLASTIVEESKLLVAETTWFSMKGKEYPSPSDPPVNY